MKLDAKNDPAIREFENWVKDELHGERTEQPSTTEASDHDEPPAPRAGEREWRVDGYEINDGQRSIVRAPRPDEFPGLTSDQRKRVRAASLENLTRIVTEHNQHATLVEQRERLVQMLKITAHNAADGSGLCWCEVDDRVFGHHQKCTSIRRVLNEVLTAIEPERET